MKENINLFWKKKLIKKKNFFKTKKTPKNKDSGILLKSQIYLKDFQYTNVLPHPAPSYTWTFQLGYANYSN